MAQDNPSPAWGGDAQGQLPVSERSHFHGDFEPRLEQAPPALGAPTFTVTRRPGTGPGPAARCRAGAASLVPPRGAGARALPAAVREEATFP